MRFPLQGNRRHAWRIDGQLEGEAIAHMDVRKDSFLAFLLHTLVLDVVNRAFLIQHRGDRFEPIGE